MSEPSDQSAQPQDKWSGRLTNTKDGIDILRQLLIVGIIVILIAWPTAFKNTLATLGIKKLGIAGAEVEMIQEASETTGDTTQKLEEANKGFESAQENLKSLIRQTNNEELKKRLEELSAQLDKSLKTTTNAQQSLNVSLASQTSILQNADPKDIPAQGPWAIVISADKKLDPDARDELKKAQALGYQNIKIYNRQGLLRTVVEFPTFTQGQDALPRLRSHHGSAYLVNMSKWCPSPKQEQDIVWQCLGDQM